MFHFSTCQFVQSQNSYYCLKFKMMDSFIRQEFSFPFTYISRVLAYPNESYLFSESNVERMIDFSPMKASSTWHAQQIFEKIYEIQAFQKRELVGSPL